MQPICIGQKSSKYFSTSGGYAPRALAAEAAPAFHVPELGQVPAPLAARATGGRAWQKRAGERTLSGNNRKLRKAGGLNHAANQLPPNAAYLPCCKKNENIFCSGVASAL